MSAPVDGWRAPRASSPVRATVVVPGSKSQTNRALVLAALADGPGVIRSALRARDTDLMAGALRSLGTDVTASPGGDWAVTPAPLRGPARVDCGLAGTVMRFVPPVASLAQGTVDFDGDPYARQRPMGPVLDALRALGAGIDDDGRGTLPFTLHGSGALAGGEVVIDASASSQFVSALLLAGARYDKGVTVVHQGPPVPSAPHIAMTVAMLTAAGVDVDTSVPDRWAVAPGPVRAQDVTIEPDLSNASPFLAAAVVTGGEVLVPGWPRATTQAGDALRDLLAALGASVEFTADGLLVAGSGRVTGIDVDLHDVGELTPVLVAIAALADSPSTLRGIGHLRGHETDRLAALAAEVGQLGGDVEVTDDGLEVRPRPLHGGLWRSYADHRMAHAGAVLGLVVDGVEVEDIATTTKTLPDFTGMWAGMLAGDAR